MAEQQQQQLDEAQSGQQTEGYNNSGGGDGDGAEGSSYNVTDSTVRDIRGGENGEDISAREAAAATAAAYQPGTAADVQRHADQRIRPAGGRPLGGTT